MFGGLHSELAALKTAGDWLAESGWVETLVQVDIASTGTVDSFLRAVHIACTRHIHKVTAAALNILQHRTYDDYARAADKVARVIGEFEKAQEHHDSKAQMLHQDQTERLQKSLDNDVR
jgi:hypothetical protein